MLEYSNRRKNCYIETQQGLCVRYSCNLTGISTLPIRWAVTLQEMRWKINLHAAGDLLSLGPRSDPAIPGPTAAKPDEARVTADRYVWTNRIFSDRYLW